MNINEVLQKILQVMHEKKATRIFIQDLRGVSDIADMQIICSGDNDRQTRAICDGLVEMMARDLGMKPIATEGKQTGQWILLDFGSLLIHVFFNPIRDYYALEQLWPNAKILDPVQLGAKSDGQA